jgi:hypothetical protein
MPDIDRMYLSYSPAAGNAELFYRHLRFRDTGEIHDGEIVMVLELRESLAAAD